MRPARSCSVLLLLLLLLIVCLTIAGCVGSFPITTALYRRNRRIEGEAGRQAAFIALIVLPVYELGLVADLLVLNPIECWTGQDLGDASHGGDGGFETEKASCADAADARR